MKSGTVDVMFRDGGNKKYENVANLSFGIDWVFFKFANGSRLQLPVKDIKNISEDGDVYVKGNRIDQDASKE